MHYSSVWQIMKYKNFSEQTAKKLVRLLHEVSIATVILQAPDIFRGKSPTIIPSFFTATAYLTRYLPTFAFSDSSRSSPVTASLVAIVTHTQHFLSQISILMCNGFLSN